MPALPFSSASSSASTSPLSSPRTPHATPSIVLHPASGTSSSKRELHHATEDVTSAYRLRYAQYLAATFNMSLQAALAEADSQLQRAPRRASDMTEAQLLRES